MSYRVGVIGCTGIGTQHASGLVGLTDAKLVAGCDLSSSVLKQFQEHWAEEWPDVATYTDHRQMLAEARLDIVTVATSDHKHADLVVDAAQAGIKGIFCEKPISNNLSSAKKIVDHCKKHKVGIFEGFMYQFHSQHQKIRELITFMLLLILQPVIENMLILV